MTRLFALVFAVVFALATPALAQQPTPVPPPPAAKVYKPLATLTFEQVYDKLCGHKKDGDRLACFMEVRAENVRVIAGPVTDDELIVTPHPDTPQVPSCFGGTYTPQRLDAPQYQYDWRQTRPPGTYVPHAPLPTK